MLAYLIYFPISAFGTYIEQRMPPCPLPYPPPRPGPRRSLRPLRHPRMRPSPCGRRSSAATTRRPATPPRGRGDPPRPYGATGNAAAAARDAGYAEGSARQTGHDLLDRSAIAERVRAIRAAWQAVELEESQILLGRLEQAWDAAVEKGSASLMIRVVKLQADLSGLDRRHAHRRAGLWPLPGEVTGAVSGEEGPRPADAGAADSGPPMGPLAEAVRRGRHRTERALAAHRASRMILEEYDDFDEADWLATAQRLHATVEERRPRTPDRAAPPARRRGPPRPPPPP